ncbi:hypothetical protein [Photobacterium damselae]|uniref:hypothetical protein n=1 Tax=Photobacterium damselae TaxID=38293 RepID=UPI000D082378|nr:hypothetical protein [Photobacterium damselae]AWK84727.1 hypothetical protein BST98_22150 [Photobacterium damselae]MCG3826259.1 hypothetical protein [Photobacterium damselae]PSB84104.1 hypothetical protein C5F64_13740 [Photobacterium damselae subsp. damselae]TLS88335.1 hypothetical protein FD720_05770 [Photobacterium damselae subsp. damselae]
MITKTGQQILSELRSEQLMAISDKKWWFVFKDVGTIPHFLYKLCLEFGKSIFVYSTTILILLIATSNEHSINLLLSKPISGIIEFKAELIYLVISLTIIYLCFYSFYYWNKYISNKKKHQIDNKKFYHEQRMQIELIEEVLYRHQLINRKD